jgi:hypothetical protein
MIIMSVVLRTLLLSSAPGSQSSLLRPRSGATALAPPAERPVAPTMSNKPHLHGVFVDITTVTATWTEDEWAQDLQAMVDVGISFFVIHHTATGSANASSACPAGTYEAYFPVSMDCFTQMPGTSTAPGGTVGVMLRAAQRVGDLRVHLGLAEQGKLGPIVDGVYHNPLYGRYANLTVLEQFRTAQSALTRALWHSFGASGLIDGIYTYLEGESHVCLSPVDADVTLSDRQLLIPQSPRTSGPVSPIGIVWLGATSSRLVGVHGHRFYLTERRWAGRS